MFNAVKISDSLLGLVGFNQPYNPELAIIDVDNLASRSGFKVTDNAFAKIELLKETQDYIDISDANFNDMLKKMQKASIVNVCQQVFNNSDFIDRNVLYKNAGNKIETETLPLGMVLYKIKVDSDKDIAFKINRVLLDFEGTGDVKLLLFNTAKKTPIQTKTITITTDHQEEAINWILDNSGATYKGDYYLGYITNGLTVSPYKRQWNNANVMTDIDGLCIEKYFVADYTTEEMFDLDQLEGLNEDIGVNLDISVFNDYTDFIIRNELFFARAIYLDMVINFLHTYATSTRSNRSQRISEQIVTRALLEIEGSSDTEIKITGLRPQFLREISQIKKEIAKMQKSFMGGMIMVSTLQ